jgi:hypothetical protein
MGLHARLGAVLTVGTLVLILNAYAVVQGHWDWSLEFMPDLDPGTAVEFSNDTLPSGAS